MIFFTQTITIYFQLHFIPTSKRPGQLNPLISASQSTQNDTTGQIYAFEKTLDLHTFPQIKQKRQFVTVPLFQKWILKAIRRYS